MRLRPRFNPMTKGLLRLRLGLLRRVSYRVMPVLLLSMPLLLTSCLSRQDVEAEIWLNSGLPPDICAQNPDLSKFGIYRKLDTGKIEFISYCQQIPDAAGSMITAVQLYDSVNNAKLQNILDALLPKVGSMR